MSTLNDLLRTSGLVIGQNVEAQPNGIHRVFLHAGQVWTSRDPAEVTTILGSCVAICIWDPTTGVGGINHYMLAREVGAEISTPRYATYATTALLRQLREAGAELTRARAKIFGGARILSLVHATKHDLGAENVHAARQRLHAEKIAIVGQDTGGIRGRKLIYETSTGRTTVLMVGDARD